MSYYLSEAYSDLYNPRVDSSFDDNLRFIDFMQDEDIQEVVESVFWEICDYGSTLEEAYNILEEATSLEVINEAYQNILAEARVTYGRGGAGTAEGPTPNIERQQRQAARTARVTGAVKGIRKRIDGGISRVQAAMSGARGGMGRAAKALGSKASEMASSGKARLGQLLRRGIRAVGGAIGGAGRAMERTGQRSAQSGLESRRAGRSGSGGQMELVLSPSTQERTGGTLSKVGRGLRRAGVAIRQMGRPKPERMTREQMRQRNAARTSATRAELGDVFAQRRPSDPWAGSANRPITPRVTTQSTRALPPARGRAIAALPPAREPQSSRRQEALANIEKYSRGSRQRGVRFAAPGGALSPKRAHTDIRDAASRFASSVASPMRESNELLDSILTAFIEEGYVYDYDSALEIFLALSEDVVGELVVDFLVD